MTDLPTGTVTFLFTDLEGSTRLWEQHPEAMRDALARHDEILRDAVEKRDGHVVKTTGDGLHAAFATAHDALLAATDAQRTLVTTDWLVPEPIRVRMGVHTGEADVRDGDYYGTAVNRAARISSVAHGGQLVCSHATEELVRDGLPGDITLRDLGTHQLRDLARPEHIFQIDADGLGHDFPPLRSLDAFPGNLPSRPTSFVGRDAELVKVATALERAPIVTITGVGGVGKTRLALQVAAEVIPHYPDGAWLCELAAADSPAALMQVVAASLGLPLRPGMEPVASIVEFLKGKHLLLVLDNCEHLIEAAGRLAEGVIRGCPDVRIVATSREGLAVEGEQVMPLRSLAVPDDSADTSAVAGSAAVGLFVERATAVKPDFELRPSELVSIAEVCRRLDGIPLAIELAAARAVAMSPAEIAGLLDERFRLLTGGRRTAVERHQTLRATVDWSYSLLDDRDRCVFDRLGVFAGAFGADAAAAIASGDGIERFDVLDALTDLVAKSLVVTEPADDGTTRYTLLETLRQYTRERLDELGTSDAWRRRHAAFFADLSEGLAPLLYSPDEIPARRRLHADLDNLRAAVGWALDRDDRDDNELGVRITAALSSEGSMGRASGIAEWAIRTLPFLETTTPARRYLLRTCLAYDAHAAADVERCRAFALAAIGEPVPPEVDDCAVAFSALAGSYAFEGRIAEAVDAARSGIALAADRQAPEWVSAIAYAIIAMHELGSGRRDDGRRDADRALELARGTRVPSCLVMATYAMGWALSFDEPDRSMAMLGETIELCETGAIDAVRAPAHCQRAVLLLQDGRLADAVADIRAGFERSVEIRDTLTLGAATLATVPALLQAGMAETAAAVLGAVDAGVIWTFEASGYGIFDATGVAPQVEAAIGPVAFGAARARGAELSYDEAVAFLRFSLEALQEAVTAGTE